MLAFSFNLNNLRSHPPFWNFAATIVGCDASVAGLHPSAMRGALQTELADGEDFAHCPSCSLLLRVIYDPQDFQEPEAEKGGKPPGGAHAVAAH
jgi:hypothetical protein